MGLNPGEVVREYWKRMNANDWGSVAALFSDEFVLEWPQSRERVRGRENFVGLNAQYPAAGTWRFTVVRKAVDAEGAATETLVTDGARNDTCVTFFEVSDGLIRKIVEYWPDPMEPEFDRKKWTEPMV